MKNKIKKHSLYWGILRINLIPIFLLALLIAAFSARRFANSMDQEVQKGLTDLCNTILTLYDTMYEGDYEIYEQDGALYMMKGEHQINGDFSIIDMVKEKTGADITVFFQDTRVITTLKGDQGERLIGTKVSAVVVRDVLECKTAAFYPGVSIDGQKYFAYYAPLINSDGSCVGMIFVGKPSRQVDRLVWQSISPILVISLFSMILAGLITMSFSTKLVDAIRKTEFFLEKTANGNLHAELNPSVLKRTDELGDMGRNAVKMQKSLQELVEEDLLTGLYNRRSAEKMLKNVLQEYMDYGVPYCISIGDIDFFKKVNDNYGHECGDMVLIEVSSRLQKHMHGKGFAARWGGEEFLLVFSNMELGKARGCLTDLLEEIRGMEIEYSEESPVKVTMTFGIVAGRDDKVEYIIKDADDMLYYGKNNGRNQVVSDQVVSDQVVSDIGDCVHSV